MSTAYIAPVVKEISAGRGSLPAESLYTGVTRRGIVGGWVYKGKSVIGCLVAYSAGIAADTHRQVPSTAYACQGYRELIMAAWLTLLRSPLTLVRRHDTGHQHYN